MRYFNSLLLALVIGRASALDKVEQLNRRQDTESGLTAATSPSVSNLPASVTAPLASITAGVASIVASISSALPPLPTNFQDVFFGVDQFIFNPPDAWKDFNSTVCNNLSGGKPGKITQQENATFVFNATGQANGHSLFS